MLFFFKIIGVSLKFGEKCLVKCLAQSTDLDTHRSVTHYIRIYLFIYYIQFLGHLPKMGSRGYRTSNSIQFKKHIKCLKSSSKDECELQEDPVKGRLKQNECFFV